MGDNLINYFWIEIKGKNIKRFLNKIFKQNINIANIKYEKDRVLLKVSYEDYRKIETIKTIYQINIIKTCGKKKLLEDIKKYQNIVIGFIISIFFVLFLSNLILFNEIESDSKDIKKIIISELKNNNVSIFSFKKSYDDLERIKEKIKNNNLDKIEWISLSMEGATLKVKVIERVNNNSLEESKYQDIVASKSGYIKKIDSRKGQVLKNIDDYVEKGEVIISGNIFRNEKVVNKLRATGKVYAEVWQIVRLSEDIKYNKIYDKGTGFFKLGLSIFDKDISFFKIPKKNITPYRKKVFTDDNLSIFYMQEKTYFLKEEKYNLNEIRNILEIRAKNAIIKTLNDDEYIIKQKTLKKQYKNGKIYVEVFFKTYEDISLAKELKKIEEKEE